MGPAQSVTMSKLLCSLAALLGLLGAWAEPDTPVANFDVTQLEGQWYLTALASDASWFANSKGSMVVVLTKMSATPTGDLLIDQSTPQADSQCWRMSNVAKKVD